MSRREEEITIYVKNIEIGERKGHAYVYVNTNAMRRAIGRHVMKVEPQPIEVRVEVDWSDSDEAKAKLPPWAAAPECFKEGES